MREQEPEPLSSLVQRVENLADALQNSSVGELELAEDGTEIIIKRQPGAGEAAPASAKQAPGTQAGVSPPQPRQEEKRGVAIVAPLTGVFYASPSPGLAPFVKVGDVIQAEQVVALIEAMKVFTEIRSDVTGRLTKICAEGGAVVKKDELLFLVEPL